MEPRRPVPDFELTPELLGAQGQALRRLARSLLGDAHAAEDVVQETWVACLRRPGELPERVSAWLGGVTRRMALRRARDDGRRRERESRVAAEPSRAAPDARGLEREEALRGVTLALLALDEPYKTALLLRYYENLAPAEIARELGVPLATVKSRLARGLEKLRASLGREFGEERRGRALALLAGAPAVPGGATSITIGGLALGAKAKVAAVAGVLLCGILWVLGGEGRTPVRGAIGSAPDPGARPARLASLAPPGAPELGTTPIIPAETRREAVPTPSEEGAEGAPFPAEAGHVQRLVGRLRDAEDLPIVGASVLLAPQGLGFNLATHTDDEGRFALAFATRRAVLRCALDVRDAQGNELGLRELEFHEGRTTEVDLALRALPLQQGGLEISVRGAFLEGGGFELRAADLLALKEGRLHGDPGLPEMALGPDGRRYFVESWPPRSCPAEEGRTTPQVEVLGDLPLLGFVRGESLGEGGELVLGFLQPGPTADAEPGRATVRGLVRAPDGRLLAGVEVGYGRPGQGLLARVTSDENGSFELADVPLGTWRFRAQGPAGRCDELVTVAASEPCAWNPLLERGDELAGRILLPDGEPLAGSELELWSTGPLLYRAVTRTNEDGRFAFQALPAEPFELHVCAEGARFPVRLVPSLRAPGDLGALQLEARELERHTLTLALLEADGERLAGGELRLWHVASGRGVVRRGLDEEGRLPCDGLPTGAYRVEVGGPLGWRDLGTHWIGEDLDLGEVRFPRPGLLRLACDAPRPGDPRVPFTLWSVHPDVLARLEEHAALEPLLRGARPGDYVLCLGQGAAGGGVALTVASGATTALLLDGPRPPRAAEESGAQEDRSDCRACHAEEH